jgi:hypothetical protein
MSHRCDLLHFGHVSLLEKRGLLRRQPSRMGLLAHPMGAKCIRRCALGVPANLGGAGGALRGVFVKVLIRTHLQKVWYVSLKSATGATPFWIGRQGYPPETTVIGGLDAN